MAGGRGRESNLSWKQNENLQTTWLWLLCFLHLESSHAKRTHVQCYGVTSLGSTPRNTQHFLSLHILLPYSKPARGHMRVPTDFSEKWARAQPLWSAVWGRATAVHKYNPCPSNFTFKVKNLHIYKYIYVYVYKCVCTHLHKKHTQGN